MLHRKAAPLRTHAMATEDGLHVLHVAEYGSPNAIPVVYLHGGPGGGIPVDAPRLFDPEVFRLVVFDQRGCGKSTCEDRLRGNTTDMLISDIESVRKHLGIQRWAVVGSSYGALLTSLYAARHAASITFAIVHGAFLGTRAEVGWLYESGGASRFYPQQWDAHMAPRCQSDTLDAGRSEAHGTDTPALVADFYRVLSDSAVDRTHPPSADTPPPPAALAAAVALTAWEDEMETIAPTPASHEPGELISGAQIAAHYFYHGCFLHASDEVAASAADAEPAAAYLPGGILPELRAAAKELSTVPCFIVHGRHDVVCPPRAATRLHDAWPHSSLRIVEGGAHALFEKPMRAAVQAALADFASRQQAGASAGVEAGVSGSPTKRRRGNP